MNANDLPSSVDGLGSVGSKVLGEVSLPSVIDKLYWDINSQLAAFVFFCSYQEYGVETTSRMCLYMNGCLYYACTKIKFTAEPPATGSPHIARTKTI